MITQADRQFYQVQLDSALSKLERHYGVSFTMPRVEWNLRGRSTLGKANGTRLITLHQKFAAVLGREAYTQTVLHELCHSVTNQRRGSYSRPSSGPWSSHGAEWKGAMRALGLKPDRCAAVSTEDLNKVAPKRRVERFPVYCLCLTPHQVTKAMYDKINRGASCKCNTCKVAVTPRKGTVMNPQAALYTRLAPRPTHSRCCAASITAAGYCSICSEEIA